jgi:hypothetical protein
MEEKTRRYKCGLGMADAGVTVFLGQEWRDSRNLELIGAAGGLTSCGKARRKRLP